MHVITGGTGSMGRRLARALLDQGKRVRVLHLPEDPAVGGATGPVDPLYALRRAGAEFVAADITRPDTLTPALRGADKVFHLAAILLAPGRPDLFRQVNRDGTANVLNASRSAGVTQFIHVSSISVRYARGNAYSESKLLAEATVRESGIPFTILRPSLAYCEDGGLEFMRFVDYLRRTPIACVPCRGLARKSPVHVEDLIQAFVSASENPLALGRTYDLTGGESTTLMQMAAMLLEHMGSSKALVGLPVRMSRLGVWVSATAAWVAGKENGFTYQTFTGFLESADFPCEDARRDLGFNPRPFREALSRLPQWGGGRHG